jgi:putative transcriptional regulator
MQNKTHQHDTETQIYGKTDWAALDAMTDEEIEAAALADPDCPPWSEGTPMSRAPRIKYVRLKLGLNPTALAERHAIPRDTILAWERLKTDEDAVALADLNAILADPEGVAAAVAKSRGLSDTQPQVAPKAAE